MVASIERFISPRGGGTITDLQERIAERPDVVEKLRRQILVHSSDTEIIGMHASARSAFIECHQLFALLETPQRRGKRSDIHCLCRYVEKMREQAADLAIEAHE
jgi:RecB family endonuclease NucS